MYVFILNCCILHFSPPHFLNDVAQTTKKVCLPTELIHFFLCTVTNERPKHR